MHEPDLPVELLSLIFCQCLPNTPTSPIYHSFPLNLAHVCSRWRRVAFQIPEVWTYIRIEAFHTDHYRTGRKTLDVLREQCALWFHYARDRPLTLFLDLAAVEPIQGRMIDPAWPRFLRYALIERANSLRGLHLVYGNVKHYQELFKARSTIFPLLEDIRIQCTARSGPAIYVPNDQETLFSRAPQLQRVWLNRKQPHTRHYRIPFQQLTHLTVPYDLSLYQLLKLSPQLQRLCVHLEPGLIHHGLVEPLEVLVLEDLEYLTIHSHRSLDEAIFSGIQLPSLTHFHLFVESGSTDIRFNWHSPEKIHEHFLGVLKNLRTLSIINPSDISEKQLIDLIEFLPQLETLILDVGCFVHPRFLYALNDSPRLIPHLKELHVFLERNEPHFNEDSANMAMRTIARILAARSNLQGNPGACLNKAVFWTHEPHERQALRRWKEAEETMRAQLTNMPSLDGRIVPVQSRVDWFDWWNRTAAIEQESF